MRGFTIFLMSLCWLTALAPGPSRADSPVVVELFTSQGCSSCPPADRLLQQIAGREDVIALALHVDYWDYIGWADTFGSPAHSRRQKTYALALGQRTLYTPQMVIDGTRIVIGAKPMKVWDAIDAAKNAQNKVPVTLSRVNQTLSIAAPARALIEPVDVRLFQYLPSGRVKITRGENAGNTFTYTNVVREIKTLDTWSGRAPLDLSIPISPDSPYVVVLQSQNSMEIIGAAQLR